MNTRFEKLTDLAAYIAIAIVWIGTALLLAGCGGGGGGGKGTLQLLTNAVLPRL